MSNRSFKAGETVYCLVDGQNATIERARLMTDEIQVCSSCHGTPWDPKFGDLHPVRPRFCVNCKYASHDLCCNHPKERDKQSLVTGLEPSQGKTCDYMRYTGPCGLEGKLYEDHD